MLDMSGIVFVSTCGGGAAIPKEICAFSRATRSACAHEKESGDDEPGWHCGCGEGVVAESAICGAEAA